MRKDPRVYLAQILERADRILDFTLEGRQPFFPFEGTSPSTKIRKRWVRRRMYDVHGNQRVTEPTSSGIV